MATSNFPVAREGDVLLRACRPEHRQHVWFSLEPPMPPCTLVTTANGPLIADWLQPLGIHQPAVSFTNESGSAPAVVPKMHVQQIQDVVLPLEEVVPSESGGVV